MARRFLLSLPCVAVLAAARAAAQTPETTPAPAAAEPAPATDVRAPLDQLGACVESGKLNVAVDLLEGKFPAAPAWTVVTAGSPLATISVDAAQGKVKRLDASVANGTVLVSGRGLRPKVYVEAFGYEDGKGLFGAKFHGKGIWRPIVAIFRGVATSALQKLELKTDIPSILRGEVLASRTAPPGKGAPPPTPTPPSEAPPPPATPPSPGPSFLDLVREVRVTDSAIVAYAGRPLALGDMVRFQTGSGTETGFPLRVTVDRGTFRPGRGGAPAQLDIGGRVDGEVQNGAIAFGDSRGTFSRAELRAGTYRVASAEAGALRTEIGAASFALDLTSGDVRLPGGPEVSVDPPSRLGFRNLKVAADGSYSGLVDADLHGKVGRIARAGSVVSATDIRLRMQGARVANGRADGDLDLQFLYRVEYPLVVHYPVEEIGERRVPLVFQGPFATRLHFEGATKDAGTVTGDYSFRIPWPPVEQAALELLKARWSQDVAAVVKRVDFEIVPRRFGPCGGTCFVVDLNVTAEKKRSSGKRLFKQVCEPEGKADLVVDAPSRSFQLRNIKLETRCKGVVGWIVNFLSPFLTKSYTDMTVFQMPPGLPFSIESVGSGANSIAIAGRVEWEAATEAPAGPAPPKP